MDYVTRQFINLAKHFRKDLRKALSDLNRALQKQTEAIRDSYQTRNNKESPRPEMTVLNNLPSSIQVHQDEQGTKHERNYRRFMFLVSTLTLGAIAVYAALVYWQYREMQKTTIATQKAANAATDAAKTARESLVDVQRAFVTFANIYQTRAKISGTTGHTWEFTPVIQNTGTTNATLLGSAVGSQIRNEPTEEVFLKTRASFAPIPLGPKVTQPIGPRNEDESVLFGKDLGDDPRVVQALFQAGKIKIEHNIVIWFWIAYRDVFRGTPVHVTEFCDGMVQVNYTFSSGIGFETRSCGQHNCTDKDCADYDQVVKLVAEGERKEFCAHNPKSCK
jgi:hypothetical protein